MAALLTLVVLAAVIAVVATPLLRARGESSSREATAASRSELQAARESKYREIRDAELDYRTGKLSQEDYEAVDAQLRAEAIEILDRLQALESGRGAPGRRESGGPIHS